jgi:hypothetical protein
MHIRIYIYYSLPRWHVFHPRSFIPMLRLHKSDGFVADGRLGKRSDLHKLPVVA